MNEWVAEVVAGHPDRFALVATPPLHDVAASIAETERCVRELNACAVQVYTTTGRARPDEPAFEPFWLAVDALGIPVVLHPALPDYAGALAGYGMVAALSTRFEDTIALTRLILSGWFDRHPSLAVVCPHLGGALPYIVGQLDHQTTVLGCGAEHITKPPSAYLRQVYLDTVSPWPPALRFCYELLGPERLLFGSDHPWIEPRLLAGMIDQLALPPAHRVLIMGENARRLFKLG